MFESVSHSNGVLPSAGWKCYEKGIQDLTIVEAWLFKLREFSNEGFKIFNRPLRLNLRQTMILFYWPFYIHFSFLPSPVLTFHVCLSVSSNLHTRIIFPLTHISYTFFIIILVDSLGIATCFLTYYIPKKYCFY